MGGCGGGRVQGPPWPQLRACRGHRRWRGDAGGESEIPLRVVGYGHVGDSNLHLNVCTPGRKRPTPEVTDVIEPFVYDFVREKKGSISAEHGLGQMKPAKIFHSKSKDSVGLMRQVKALFDPRGICNPYKMLPAVEVGD